MHALCDSTAQAVEPCPPHRGHVFSCSLRGRCSQGPWAVPQSTLPKTCWELSFLVLRKAESWLQRACKSNSCQREAISQITDVNERKSSMQLCGIPMKSSLFKNKTQRTLKMSGKLEASLLTTALLILATLSKSKRWKSPVPVRTHEVL